MFTGVFKHKDGTPLAIRDTSVVVTIDGNDYALADIIDAMQVVHLPFYFDKSTTERHTVLPEGVTKIQLASIEADGSGTSGLTITMAHDIGEGSSLTLTEAEADCSAFAGRGVVFTVEGMSDQTKVAAMALISPVMAQFLMSWPGSNAAEPPTTWEFDTIENCTTAGVPISTSTAYAGMQIDWGDGTTTTVESVSDYVHTYAEAGQYHIVVTYDDWANVELSYSASAVSPIAEARTSIAKAYAIPHVANTSLQRLFYRYTALAEVADDIFAYNPQVVDFAGTLQGCTSLVSVPAKLFAGNPDATNFQTTFQQCSSLASLPEDLFANNTAVTEFYGTFFGCESLASIPAGLFRNNKAVESFQMTFYGCPSLAEIPEGLFDNNTEVTSFFGTFYSCVSLATVPVELFAKNTKVESFHGIFDYTALAANSQCENGIQYFALDIASEVVTVFGDNDAQFWRPETAAVDAIYVNVPEGSTTETTALAYNESNSDYALTLNTTPCA